MESMKKEMVITVTRIKNDTIRTNGVHSMNPNHITPKITRQRKTKNKNTSKLK
jgi:hypothetical protein